MVLVLSEEKDYSTNIVLDWMSYMNVPFIRINPEDSIELKSLDIDNNKFLIEINLKKVISSEEITGFWYRRGYFNFELLNTSIFSTLNSEFKKKLILDRNIYSEIIYEKLTQCKFTIGDYFTGDVNKIKVLNIAKKIGLKTPFSKIITNKLELIEFKDRFKNIITKPLSSSNIFLTDDFIGISYTTEITDEIIENLNFNFSPTFFQEKIEKKYEIRTFFLKEKFYSMAIFSQNDPQTLTDFRKYNWSRPNRSTPYQLPTNIEDNLKKLMLSCSLDTGSIDIIVDKNNDYYFLEVNPVGQFGMTSYPCNYFLERQIANVFI